MPNSNGETVRVHQNTFSTVFVLTAKKLQILNNRKKCSESVVIEKWGNKIVNRKFTDDIKDSVVEHVNTLPHDVSHYSRIKNCFKHLKNI